jgi:hypothetical protein
MFTFFLHYYFLFAQYLYADLTLCHISMVISSAMAKSPWQHHLQQRRHQHGSTTTLRHSQVDSASTSCHDQHHLGSSVTNMTQGLGGYFPDLHSELEDHCQSSSMA